MTNTSFHFWETDRPIHQDLLAAKKLLYDPCGFDCTLPRAEAESAEYGAYDFEINGLSAKYRVAKITPTKIGQFVTLWKRVGEGPIQPFDHSDPIDFFVVSTRSGNDFGQFVFPKSVLLEKGILSDCNREGKRAIRVYPPWDHATNKQAIKTQKWQLDYFLDIAEGQSVDFTRAKKLFERR